MHCHAARPDCVHSNQATSLRFLLHFVGDIQQPLHCADGYSSAHPTGDAGGNSFSVTGWPNLHYLWDSGGGYLTDSVSRPLSDTALALIPNTASAVSALY